MSVIIKGMEMPKNCVECQLFHFYIDLNGILHFVCKYSNVDMCGNVGKERNDICSLIEVEEKEDE